jgi:metal-responsive CopG/Arc/MetJ family transcriptional regulator
MKIPLEENISLRVDTVASTRSEFIRNVVNAYLAQQPKTNQEGRKQDTPNGNSDGADKQSR